MADFEVLRGKAILAERVERFADVIKFIDKMDDSWKKTEDIIKLWCIASKQILEQDRNSILAIKEFTNYSNQSIGSKAGKEYNIYLKFLESRFSNNCRNFNGMLGEMTSWKDLRPETIIQLNKTAGDYLRYELELDLSTNHDESLKVKAERYYATASSEIDKFCPSPMTNILKLSVKLNFAIFLYERMKKKDEAQKLLKENLEEGLENLESQKDSEELKEYTYLLNLMDKTMFKWKDQQKMEH